MESARLGGDENYSKRLVVLRALDKVDRFGIDGLVYLLGKGRKDESGDFTPGADLEKDQIDLVTKYASWQSQKLVQLLDGSGAYRRVILGADGKTRFEKPDNRHNLENFKLIFGENEKLSEGVDELLKMALLFESAGYDSDRLVIDPTIVRGLEYYTGPVFECELLMENKDEDGKPVQFGSVGGGGRYDDLVARFTGQQTPATGFSIGVSRLYAALKLVGKAEESAVLAPVVVTVMDKERQGDYWRMVQQLRQAGIRAEMSLGAANMGKQMKYADKRGSPLVVIQGGDEKALGQVTIKDLRLGAELASSIETREEYASQRLAQVTVAEADLVKTVQEMLKQK